MYNILSNFSEILEDQVMEFSKTQNVILYCTELKVQVQVLYNKTVFINVQARHTYQVSALCILQTAGNGQRILSS